MELIDLPGATLRMGSNADEVHSCVRYWGARLVDAAYNTDEFQRWILKEFPKHPVKISPFAIGRFPVTNREYSRFLSETMGLAPESIKCGEPDDHPVWGISFEEALEYAAWFGNRAGLTCRLPTEAEWEYAARGPSGRDYPFGTAFDPERCNTFESGVGRTTPVNQYPAGASEFGICDMAGNVEEWTMDLYAPYPGGVFICDDLSEVWGGRYRILRGGSFARGGDLARCARRHGPFPSPVFRYTGFRIVAAPAS
ncbi:MAG: toxoflavin biosynthesis protein ToxD [Acidobacteriota bacterium]|jgi:formylglycine-generating enzyme required for sulfatase activity|nr:toxoflavin biosynthesis protein ToxD [Acidobacteriota bacterium]